MDVLVRATRYSEWDPAVTFAAGLAARFHGSVSAVHVVEADLPLLPSYDGGLIAAAYWSQVKAAVEAAEAAAPAFEAWATSVGARDPRWRVSAGNVRDTFAYMGNWHDMLTLAGDAADSWGSPSGIAAVVVGVSLPCLVLPAGAANDPARMDCIAVAWNGSIEAIRAVHGALPLLKLARRVVVMRGHAKPVLAPLPDFELERWCQQHHLPVEYVDLTEVPDEASYILATAQAASADLLVMGAYGRSRFAELALGGVTRHMLEHARLPLLMRH